MDLHGEVSILEALRTLPGACALHDFGVDVAAGQALLVMRDYPASLRCGPRGGACPMSRARRYCRGTAEGLPRLADVDSRSAASVALLASAPAPPCVRRQWRSRLPASPAGQLRLYYSVFLEVVVAVQVRGHACIKAGRALLLGLSTGGDGGAGAGGGAAQAGPQGAADGA